MFTQPFIQTQIKKSKLRVTGLCAGNSPGTGEFPVQMASNAEYVSIWWRHHGITILQWAKEELAIITYLIQKIISTPLFAVIFIFYEYALG